MKTTLLATVAIFAAASANAADMSAPAYKAPAAVETGWTGGYLGVSGGYGWGHLDVEATPGDPNTQRVHNGQPSVPTISSSTNPKGWLGGIQAGYDWQLASRLVLGFEADFNGADIKGAASAPSIIAYGTQTASLSSSQRIGWFGTVRARAGVLPTSGTLLYATGGLAYGKVDDSAALSLPSGQSNSSANFGYGYACGPVYGLGASCFGGATSRVAAGWAAGAGGEQRITQNVSLTLEYLHVDLGHGSYRMTGSLPSGAPFTPSVLNAGSNAAFDLVHAGLNYRF